MGFLKSGVLRGTMGWQLDLYSDFYLYSEFQDSKLGTVRLVGKITLLDTTSMKGPSLNSVVLGPHSPGNRAKNLPCFANAESISNSSSIPTFSLVTTMPSLYSWQPVSFMSSKAFVSS
uniref:Uncharacterized protein n=1 Tax=Salix viminalis TaxID=40686 RepID=A0A6N2LXX0_SALVM